MIVKRIGLGLLCSLALGEAATAAVWFDVDAGQIRKDDDLAKEMYSTALAAYLSGKTITVGTTGCDAVGNVIQAIAIKNN